MIPTKLEVLKARMILAEDMKSKAEEQIVKLVAEITKEETPVKPVVEPVVEE
jgi:hypothetical protein